MTTPVEIVMWVVVGLTVGWLAGSTMKGRGYGIAGDVAIGVVGAVAGAWLIAFAVAETERGGLVGVILAAAIGGLAFVVLARLLTRRPSQA